MNGLIENLNLQEVLDGIELRTQSNNLEDIYSELHSRPECRYATEELENAYTSTLNLWNLLTNLQFMIFSFSV